MPNGPRVGATIASPKNNSIGREHGTTLRRRAARWALRLNEFGVDHDGQWHDYDVRLRIDSPLTALRLDLAQAAGHIDVVSVQLIDNSGTTLREWHYDR